MTVYKVLRGAPPLVYTTSHVYPSEPAYAWLKAWHADHLLPRAIAVPVPYTSRPTNIGLFQPIVAGGRPILRFRACYYIPEDDESFARITRIIEGWGK